MSEPTASDRTAFASRPQSGSLRIPAGRYLAVAAVVIIVLVIATVSFRLGVNTGDEEVAGSNNTIQNLQAENRKLTSANNDLQSKLADLQAKLTNVQATLDALIPSVNTYKLGPNQSLTVADGHLTIGLVGSPGNNAANLNINGKQYSAAAGDIINIAIDPSMNCRVEVRSFVFNVDAVFNATCTEAKQ